MMTVKLHFNIWHRYFNDFYAGVLDTSEHSGRDMLRAKLEKQLVESVSLVIIM